MAISEACAKDLALPSATNNDQIKEVPQTTLYICGDCLEVMTRIPDGSIDMILCDLPYGTTTCKWDIIIPFAPLWAQYQRILAANGTVVLFGSEPFASHLRLSNLAMYKYDWFWNKASNSGFVNAKLKPMNTIETISVFSRGKTSNGNKNNMRYYPQGLVPYNKLAKNGTSNKENTFYRKNNKSSSGGYIQEFTNYPKNYLEFTMVRGKAVHPTQKPVALLEYLIKTYTNSGDTVLDNAMGSGSTGVAAINTGRNFFGIELDEKYFAIAQSRISQALNSHSQGSDE